MEEQTNLFASASKAISRGDIAEVNNYLDLRPSLMIERDERGRTLLHLAALDGGDQVDIIQLLLSRGANKDVVDNDGWTAGDWADFIINPGVLMILTGRTTTD